MCSGSTTPAVADLQIRIIIHNCKDAPRRLTPLLRQRLRQSGESLAGRIAYLELGPFDVL